MREHYLSSARAELDSHANMVVMGKHCILLTEPGNRCCRVKAFSPEHEAIEIPIVDALVAWTNQQTHEPHLLKFENVLYVESMEHHLIPPFILREAGYIVNDVPCIHTRESDISDDTHCIKIPDGEERTLRIPLDLHGVFSYFTTWVPTKEIVGTIPGDRTHIMTPNYAWDPSHTQYQ